MAAQPSELGPFFRHAFRLAVPHLQPQLLFAGDLVCALRLGDLTLGSHPFELFDVHRAKLPQSLYVGKRWPQKTFMEGLQHPHVAGNRARTTAYQVLDSWKSLPGMAKSGAVDPAALSEWVHKALAKTAEQGRPTLGAQQVGKVLSHAPAGTDGAWPHEAVRDLIEKLENPEIERGFEIGKFNSRGVVRRSLTDGGRQEHVLADQYAGWAAQINDRWPRTAAILRRMEATYRNEARREDAETDLRNDGIW